MKEGGGVVDFGWWVTAAVIGFVVSLFPFPVPSSSCCGPSIGKERDVTAAFSSLLHSFVLARCGKINRIRN